MSNLMIPPALLLVGSAIVTIFLPKKIRSIFFLLAGAGVLLSLFFFNPQMKPLTVKLMNYTLILLKVDRLSIGFGIVLAIALIAGGIYSFHMKEKGQQTAALLYAGGAMGVVFAGDFFTLFFFWELMAISSTILIWARRSDESQKAGTRYVIYHALGGGIFLGGILSHVFSNGGSIEVTSIFNDGSIGVWMMLIGVIINTAIPPLHTWLVDAYPKATITGAVFLNAFTTKTAVYVLARLFLGWKVLIILGTIMALYGVIYTVLANDMRGILSYHIVSQVGYMVAAVGIGSAIALNGAVAHAFSNIFFKGLLFMATGAVMYGAKNSKLTNLGGLGKHMRWVCILYMVGAFSIAGFPLFNGFITKSMVLTAAAEGHYPTVFLLLNLAAIGTFLSVGLKLPYYVFFHKDKPKEIKLEKIPLNLYLGMFFLAFLCVLHGVIPSLLYNLLPNQLENFHPYTAAHISEVLQMFGFAFAAFLIFRNNTLKPKNMIVVDVDLFFRKPAGIVRKIFVDGTVYIFNVVDKFFMRVTNILIVFGKNPLKYAYSSKDNKYSPDKYRPAISMMVFAILLLFLICMFMAI